MGRNCSSVQLNGEYRQYSIQHLYQGSAVLLSALNILGLHAVCEAEPDISGKAEAACRRS